MVVRDEQITLIINRDSKRVSQPCRKHSQFPWISGSKDICIGSECLLIGDKIGPDVKVGSVIIQTDLREIFDEQNRRRMSSFPNRGIYTSAATKVDSTITGQRASTDIERVSMNGKLIDLVCPLCDVNVVGNGLVEITRAAPRTIAIGIIDAND